METLLTQKYKNIFLKLSKKFKWQDEDCWLQYLEDEKHPCLVEILYEAHMQFKFSSSHI